MSGQQRDLCQDSELRRSQSQWTVTARSYLRTRMLTVRIGSLRVSLKYLLIVRKGQDSHGQEWSVREAWCMG